MKNFIFCAVFDRVINQPLPHAKMDALFQFALNDAVIVATFRHKIPTFCNNYRIL